MAPVCCLTVFIDRRCLRLEHFEAMENPYSNFSSVDEFLHHTTGMTRRETLQSASRELGALREVVNARISVRKKYFHLVQYKFELDRLFYYFRDGKMEIALFSPESSNLRKNLEDRRKEFEIKDDWLKSKAP